MLRQYEDWAWAVGIALICADMVLLIPQTAVIAALGIIYETDCWAVSPKSPAASSATD